MRAWQLMLDRGITVTDEVCVKLSIPPPTKDASEVKFKLRHIDELISLSDGQVIWPFLLPKQALMLDAFPSRLSCTDGSGIDTVG